MQESKGKFARWMRVIVGGPMGVVAWCISGMSAAAIVVWGLQTVALPLLMLKTASWGIWGLGVMRESKVGRGWLKSVLGMGKADRNKDRPED
jgi:hypothetical protein